MNENKYVSPLVEVAVLSVEQGFAPSGGVPEDMDWEDA